MEISRELLFFFSALGAFNGILMGLYFLFIAKPRHISNYFLGALLIAFSIRIGKSVFFYFNPDLAYSYLQFGLTGCFFIGPFLYFYVKSVIYPKGMITKEWIYHLLVLLPIVAFVSFKYPFEQHVDLWRWTIINSIYHVWLFYSLLAAYVMKDTFIKMFSKGSKLENIEKWTISIFIGNMMIWAAYYYAGLGSYILGALLFSFMLYLLILLIFFKQKKSSILLKDQEKYKDKKIAAPAAQQLLKKLTDKMTEDELFKNPNLKLADLAKKMNVLPHTISQLLNDNFGKGFPQYLNEFRIAEAKKLLVSEHNTTLEAIGYDCGFNSKSTFFSAFKKITGTTPAKYKASQQIIP